MKNLSTCPDKRLSSYLGSISRWASQMRLRNSRKLFLFMVFSFSAQAQDSIEVPLKPSKPNVPQPYEGISFVSEGPTYGNTDEAVRGRYQRVLVIAGNLAYDHPTIRLETLTYGDEGCCRRIVGAWDFRLEEIINKGILLPRVEMSEFKFIRWQNAHSFAFSYGALRCNVLRVGQPKVAVSCEE